MTPTVTRPWKMKIESRVLSAVHEQTRLDRPKSLRGGFWSASASGECHLSYVEQHHEVELRRTIVLVEVLLGEKDARSAVYCEDPSGNPRSWTRGQQRQPVMVEVQS
jgi:hypothetical protein